MAVNAGDAVTGVCACGRAARAGGEERSIHIKKRGHFAISVSVILCLLQCRGRVVSFTD